VVTSLESPPAAIARVTLDTIQPAAGATSSWVVAMVARRIATGPGRRGDDARGLFQPDPPDQVRLAVIDDDGNVLLHPTCGEPRPSFFEESGQLDVARGAGPDRRPLARRRRTTEPTRPRL